MLDEQRAPEEALEEVYLGGNIDGDLEPDIRIRAPGDDSMRPDEPLERDLDADPDVDVFVHPPSRGAAPLDQEASPSDAALASPEVVGDPVRTATGSVDTPRGGAALACVRLAETSVEIDDYEASALCTAAPSTGPATCALAALHNRVVPRFRVLELCRCASSAEPATCYESARRETALDDAEIARLCGAATRLGPDCRPRSDWD
ncbi:MAG TPA: hypothetical protein VKY73_23385 [Polyangiaceae bacterium]|nr:hypothetical protein [Polyangiaceae bacterium]